MVVLPSTIGHAAKALAEKIRKSIEALSFEEQVPGLGGITVSIGTAAYPDDGTTEEILLKSADLALYRAKQRGRKPRRGGSGLSPRRAHPNRDG